jgi:hypothetical protein
MKSTVTTQAIAFVAAFVVGCACTLAACATSNGDASSSSSAGGATTDAADGACVLCVTDGDCGGGLCVQLGGDSYCAPACPSGNECSTDRSCMPASTVEGVQASACIPRTARCGDGAGTGSSPAPAPAPNGRCGTLSGPDVTAACNSCGTHPCQANGCYGGWWCNTASSRCQAPPTTCPGAGDGGAVHIDAGGPVNGAVGPNGGTVSRLFFAVVGDTRPPVINDTKAYPTQVVTQIYADLEGSSPRPSFAVSTGDYLFSTANGTQAAPQLDIYEKARAGYSGVVFPAMGNHECTGAVDSNCGAGNKDGVTANYSAFLAKVLAPVGKTSPNYVVDVNATDGSWTSKLVFVAGNAWATTDTAWLDGVLARPTTYTFIVRHEPKAASQAPGAHDSEIVMAQHPYTLAIVGHTHTYGRTGQRQVTIGNGGAPLTGGVNYGYGLIQQRADGAIQVDMVDYATGQLDTAFRFAVHADGSSAP